MKRFTVFILTSVGLSLSHQLWAEREGNIYRIYYGHRGKAVSTVDFGKVRRAVCLSEEGPKEVKIKNDKRGAYLEGPCKAIGVEYYWGYFSQTPDGEVSKPKDEVKNAVRSWESIAYLKCVYDFSRPVRLGQELEIVPINPPRAGGKLEVEVLHNGKSTHQAFLSVEHRKVGNPHEDGRARISLNRGLNVISASLRLPADGRKADYRVVESYLCIEAE